MATHPLNIFARLFNPDFVGSISLGRKPGTTKAKNSIAVGDPSRVEASEEGASAFGKGKATGKYSMAEGTSTASGENGHAEGGDTTAQGKSSHAEGVSNTASGEGGHAEGNGTTASGKYSHAGGIGTIAKHLAQRVFGRYNTADPSTATVDAYGNFAEIVGIGTANNARKNGRTLDWNGHERLAGDLTIFESTSQQLSLSTFRSLVMLALIVRYADAWPEPDIIDEFTGNGSGAGSISVNGTTCRGQQINLGFAPSRVLIFVKAADVTIGHNESGITTPSNSMYVSLLDILCGQKLGVIRIGPMLNYYHSGCGDYRTSAPQSVLVRNHGGAVVYQNSFIVQSYNNGDVDNTMHINEKNVKYVYMAWR